MELPPLPQNSLNSGDSARVPTNAALNKLLEMTVGETLSARVVQASLATEKQRDQLLQQLINKYQLPGAQSGKAQAAQAQEVLSKTLTQALAQQAYQGSPVARQTIIPAALLSAISKSSQDSELLKILQSPQLKLLEVNVKGKTVTTYTDKPITPGQNLQLKLAGNQRLTVIDTRVSQPSMKSSDIEAARAVVRDALRTALPNQQGLQKVFSALQEINRAPRHIKSQTMPPPVQQAVRNLVDKLPTVQQLTQPNGLKRAMQNSGVQLEAKLATHLPADKLAAKAAIIKTPPLATTNIPLANTQAKIVAARIPPAATTGINRTTPGPVYAPKPVPPALINGDIKSAALTVLNKNAQVLSPTLNTQAVGLDRLFSQVDKSSNTDLLLQQIIQGSTPRTALRTSNSGEDAHTAQRNQLTQVLHQFILTSLAKLQMQQLHSLSHQQLNADQTLPTQSWLMELPFKFGHDIHSVEIRIDDEWKEQEEDDSDKKERQWEVMLSFELPEMGSFYAHLKIVKDSVSANLWAEEASTLKKVRAEVEGLRDQLTSNGIDVKEVQCFQGQPEKKELQLGYSLVDVRT